VRCETNRPAGAIGRDCRACARNVCQEPSEVNTSREPGIADASVKCLAHSAQMSSHERIPAAAFADAESPGSQSSFSHLRGFPPAARGRRFAEKLVFSDEATFRVCDKVTIDAVLANSKTQNAFLFLVHAMFRHDCPLAVKPAFTPQRLVLKKTWRDSLPTDMLLSAVFVLVVAQPSLEIPEGLMNYPVYIYIYIYIYILTPVLIVECTDCRQSHVTPEAAS